MHYSGRIISTVGKYVATLPASRVMSGAASTSARAPIRKSGRAPVLRSPLSFFRYSKKAFAARNRTAWEYTHLPNAKLSNAERSEERRVGKGCVSKFKAQCRP